MIRYLLARDKDGEWIGPVRYRTAVRRSRRWLRNRGEQFTITRKGGETSTSRDLAGTIERLKALLAEEQVGETYIIRGQLSKGPVKVRVIEVWPRPADTPGNEHVDQYIALLNEKFPGWRSAGVCVCKNTSSGGVSDHAYCAALDIFDTPARMEAIRDFTVAHAPELHVTYVILYDRIWVRNSGWKPYGGTYHWHVHTSFEHDSVRRACL